MATIEEPYSRRDFLQASGTLLSGMAIVPFVSMDTPNDDAMLLHEVKLLQGMAENTYKQLWNNLAGITDKELDWRSNKESNSLRWIVGHLCIGLKNGWRMQ